MRRVPRSHPSQLALHLAPDLKSPPSLPTSDAPTLVQALADLLLSALGQPAPESPTGRAITMEGGNEPEDHP